jgi:hypothetical protein
MNVIPLPISVADPYWVIIIHVSVIGGTQSSFTDYSGYNGLIV